MEYIRACNIYALTRGFAISLRPRQDHRHVICLLSGAEAGNLLQQSCQQIGQWKRPAGLNKLPQPGFAEFFFNLISGLGHAIAINNQDVSRLKLDFPCLAFPFREQVPGLLPWRKVVAQNRPCAQEEAGNVRSWHK